MAYDPATHQLILVGGLNWSTVRPGGQVETWNWDGNSLDKPDKKPKTIRTVQEIRVSPPERYGADPPTDD